jgi:hypothetical protein
MEEPRHVREPFAWMDGLIFESCGVSENIPFLWLKVPYAVRSADKELLSQFASCVVYYCVRGGLKTNQIFWYSVYGDDGVTQVFLRELVQIVPLPSGITLENGYLLIVAPMPHERGVERRIAGPFHCPDFF